MKSTLDGWTIVFDLDGTLVESAPDLLSALNHTLQNADAPVVQLSDIREMIGHGAKAMIRKGFELHKLPLAEEQLEKHWATFLNFYKANIAVGSYVYEGAFDALETLRRKGAILAVCTNKTQALAEEVLTQLNLIDYFSAVVGADSVPMKKPDGDHIIQTVRRVGGCSQQAIMIGDSRTDEAAAYNAQLPFLFVPFGYESVSADQIRAHAVVHHYEQLCGQIMKIAA